MIFGRLRRSGETHPVDPHTMVEPGDVFTVVGPPAEIARVVEYLGKPSQERIDLDRTAVDDRRVFVSSADVAGRTLGELDIDIRLGTAGGPLLVALVLGWLHRTGPIVWVLPYSANLTPRQIGLVLFLAAIGTRAGWEFRSLLVAGGGLTIVAAGALVTFTAALSTLWLAHRVFKMPLAQASGTVAAVQTQPAVLGFAVEQARNDLPNLTYAPAYPLALVAKIVLAQVLVELLE